MIQKILTESLKGISIIMILSSCVKSELASSRLSEDDLKWVNLVNHTPKFKLTHLIDQDTLIEIRTGKYEFYREDFENEETIHHVYYANLNLRPCFVITKRNEKLNGGVYVSEATLTLDTKLDTALVNGVVYTDVFKDTLGRNKFYYAKSIGFVYFKYDNLDEKLIYELMP